MYQFSYEITEADIVALNYANTFILPESKKSRKKALFIARIFILIVGILLAGTLLNISKSYAITILVSIVIGTFLLFLLGESENQKRKIVARLMKNLKKQGPLNLPRKAFLKIFPEYILFNSNYGEYKLFYSALKTLIHDKNALYFYFKPAIILILLLRAFSEPEEIEAVKLFIEDKLQSNQKNLIKKTSE